MTKFQKKNKFGENRLFYSTEELSCLLSELGFSIVKGKPLLGGTVPMHRACKV